MPSRIDEKTMVPLGVVVGLFSTGIMVTIAIAFWVKGVNDRLDGFDRRFERIERKFGIEAPEASLKHATDLFPIANAGVHRGPNSKR